MYILADGDDIGNRLEVLLLDKDPDGARNFSRQVTVAVKQAVEVVVRSIAGSETIFAGGDDFLIRLPDSSSCELICREVQKTFRRISGCNLSIGVGSDTEMAAHALRRAKLLGKNQIVMMTQQKSQVPHALSA